ncbi:hypothetical protein OIU74_007616, partial [Salix koriyanagi]
MKVIDGESVSAMAGKKKLMFMVCRCVAGMK